MICLLPIQVGEDELEDVTIPASRAAFKAFLDVLKSDVSVDCKISIGNALKHYLPQGALASRTCCPLGK